MSYYSLNLRKGEKRVFSKFADEKKVMDRLWYGVIQVGEKSYISEYYGKKENAKIHFVDEAKKINGEVVFVNTSK